MPGILQTEEYALAVLRLSYGEGSAAERVPALVDLRTRRRDLLISEGAPKFSFLLDESVIRRLAGGPAIMSRQLMHLADQADLPNVTIRVVPFAAGLHPGMEGPSRSSSSTTSPTKTSHSSRARAATSSVTIPRKPRVTSKPSTASRRRRSGHRNLSAFCAKRQVKWRSRQNHPRCPRSGHDLPFERVLARSPCLAYTAPLWNSCCTHGPNGLSLEQLDRNPAGWLDTLHNPRLPVPAELPPGGGKGGLWPTSRKRTLRGGRAPRPIAVPACRWRSPADRY